jgi:hypothetical protein
MAVAPQQRFLHGTVAANDGTEYFSADVHVCSIARVRPM